ncbi:MAG: DUF2723 domain-containing protein [Chloroflexota bacterium]|nr:DUF2723 domain-containing protein [Dehalococcoidia bacterium]MDW8254450.1 DUF2723 domain-containing protein [Chloroflexota bacterium]
MRGDATAPRSLRALDLTLGAAAGLAALALYVRTLAPTVLAFDSGEFQFAAPTLGLVHPTGYPLYLLLGWLFAFLPVGDVAYRINLFSAVAAAAAVALTTLLAITVLPGPAAAARLGGFAAAALAALSSDLWSQAVIAEVYALQLLLLAALTLAVVRRWPLPLVGLIVGLSLAHHRAALLTLPLLALFLAADRGRALLAPRSLALTALLAVLPLALYLYIPLRADHSPYLAQETAGGRRIVSFQNDLDGFIDMVTGRVFADKLTSPLRLEERLALFLRLAGRQWPSAVWLAAGLGALMLLVRRPREGLLVTGIFAVTVAFALLYRIGDIEVYFIPAYWAAALAAGTALGALVEAARRLAVGLALGGAATALLVGAALLTTLPRVDRSGDREVRQRWERILAAPLPPRAILASDDRDDLTPLWYFTLVEGVRPDLVGLFPGIVNSPEYADLGRLIDGVLGPGEQVFLIKEMPGLSVKYRLEPVGAVWRVVGPAVDREPPTRLDAAVGSALRLDGAEFPPQPAGATLPVALWWSVVAPPEKNLTTFVHLLDHRGQLVAQSDAPPGGVFYPTSRWRPGERLLDRHELRLPEALPAGRYSLRAGAYDEAVRRLPTASGDTVELGTVRIIRPPVVAPDRPLAADFPGVGQLEGVTVDGDRVRLFWRAAGPTPAPLTVFLHLVDGAGRLVAQADGPPADGALPTDAWLPDERLLDERRLPLRSVPPGDYRLLAGLYDPVTGQRVLLAHGGDSADLGPLRLP